MTQVFSPLQSRKSTRRTRKTHGNTWCKWMSRWQTPKKFWGTEHI